MEEKHNGFMVTIFKSLQNKVTDNQKKIILTIQKNNRITTSQLSDLVGISQRKIKENISKLKEDGIITREGPAKGGYWKITPNDT